MKIDEKDWGQVFTFDCGGMMGRCGEAAEAGVPGSPAGTEDRRSSRTHPPQLGAGLVGAEGGGVALEQLRRL